jgi:hypothetical protein
LADVEFWIGKWDHRPAWANPYQANHVDSQFGDEVSPIIAEEASDHQAGEVFTADKVDVLSAGPLVHSATKKLVVRLHVHKTAWRSEHRKEIRAAIIRRLKDRLNLPQDEACVSLTFVWVGEGDWGKS